MERRTQLTDISAPASPISFPCRELSGAKHLLRGVVLDFLHTVLLDHLDGHAFEVNGQAALQLVGAHAQDLHALIEADVWMVVLVEDGEAVVSVFGGAVLAGLMLWRRVDG